MTKNITEQQDIFITAFLEESRNGSSRTEAGWKAHEAAGYSDSYSPTRLLRTFKDEILDRMAEELVMELPQAAFKVRQVLDNPTQLGAKAALDAATWLADRAGLIKKDKTEVSVKTDQGIILLPPKKKKEE